tara:strand:+ start:1159 stop:1341 length:183 start_codon:yes stop_codon:yes gene_type:complete
MRRRQIFAMQSAATNVPESIHEEAKETSEAPEEVLKIKPCPKCGKIIARGWFAHHKFCKG